MDRKETELIVIGTLATSVNTLRRYEPLLDASFFTSERNQNIFKALKELSIEQEKISSRIVAEKSGVDYAELLEIKTYSDTHGFETHLERFRKNWQRDTILEAFTLSREEVDQQDPRDLVDKFNKVADAVFQIDLLTTNHASEFVEKTIDGILRAKEHDGKLSGIDTGLESLNKIGGGWQETDLNILAARPGMGKTSLMLNFAETASWTGPVVIVSGEMAGEQVLKKMTAAKTKITVQQMRRGDLTDAQVTEIKQTLEGITSYPIYIIDDTLDIDDIIDRVIYLNRRHDIKFCCVDYLQMLTTRKDIKRHAELSYITKALKKLAKTQAKCTVLALSQLNRSVEARGGDKRPMNSDLKESGSIEEDADMIMMMYRDSYYYRDEPDADPWTELIITKHRHGDLDTIKLKYECERLTEWVFDNTGFHQQSREDVFGPDIGGDFQQGFTTPKNDNNLSSSRPDFDTDVPF